MPAALFVLLAAFAGVFGVPATASDGPATARTVVREPAPVPARLAPRPSRPVKWTGQKVRLAAPTRSTPAVRTGMTGSGPAPTAAVSGALLLLAFAVLGRVVVGAGGWSLLRRTPGSHRGRAPPAYALALA